MKHIHIFGASGSGTPPVWSEYENFDVISPNDVSAAHDGSCWAIDWGRNRVVKIAVDGERFAETVPCDVPDPDYCLSQSMMIHPVSIDCGGDWESCFVADYEGNRIFKLTYHRQTETISTEYSTASYYRPKVVTVDRYHDVNQQLIEMVWVVDRWSEEPTPSGHATFTPVPTPTTGPSPTPRPTAPPGQPMFTPIATPYPEHQRVSQNMFGEIGLDPVIPCAIPYGLSVISSVDNNTYCYVVDRDAGWSAMGFNYVRRIELIGENPTPVQEYFGINDLREITRPVDVEAVGAPPTNTPTSTNTPTPTPEP